MITTAELRVLTAPVLEQVFAAVGHDLVVVRPGAAVGGYDNDGRRQHGPATRTEVRGLLMPADVRTAGAAKAAGLPIPSYVAYLPFTALVDVPDWYLEHGVTAYYPTADARDEGGQGVLWVAALGAPGEVIVRGEDQPAGGG